MTQPDKLMSLPELDKFIDYFEKLMEPDEVNLLPVKLAKQLADVMRENEFYKGQYDALLKTMRTVCDASALTSMPPNKRYKQAEHCLHCITYGIVRCECHASSKTSVFDLEERNMPPVLDKYLTPKKE